MQPFVLALSAQLFRMPVKALELGEKGHVIGIAVQDAHGIMPVQGRDKIVSGVPNSPHVFGRHITARADQGEVLSAQPLRGGLIRMHIMLRHKLFIQSGLCPLPKEIPNISKTSAVFRDHSKCFRSSWLIAVDRMTCKPFPIWIPPRPCA
jgi:hypothetical protein